MNEKPELNTREPIMTIANVLYRGGVYSDGTFKKIILFQTIKTSVTF